MAETQHIERIDGPRDTEGAHLRVTIDSTRLPGGGPYTIVTVETCDRTEPDGAPVIVAHDPDRSAATRKAAAALRALAGQLAPVSELPKEI